MISYTHRAHILIMHSIHEKRKSYEISERRFNNPSKDLQADRMPKVIERSGVFRDRNQRIN